MHRTYGDDYVLEGPHHRFIDEDAPTVPGTADMAEWNNAVQEEICNVIEGVGLTLNGGGDNGDPVSDRSAGWAQLFEAIFYSAFITDAAINEISFAKVKSGAIDITSGGGVHWLQSAASLSYSLSNKLTFITEEKISVSETGVGKAELFADESVFENDGIETRLNGKGLRFPDGPGISSFKAAHLRTSAFEKIGAGWSAVGSDGIFVCSPAIDTGIPVSEVPLSGFFRATVFFDNGVTQRVCPAQVDIREVGGSGFYQVIAIRILFINTVSPETDFVLVLEYDGTDIT